MNNIVSKTTDAKLLVAIGTSNKGSLFNRKLFDAYLAFVLPSIPGAETNTNPEKESFYRQFCSDDRILQVKHLRLDFLLLLVGNFFSILLCFAFGGGLGGVDRFIVRIMFRFIIIIDIIIAAIDIVIVILLRIAVMMSLAFRYLSCRVAGRPFRLRRCRAFFSVRRVFGGIMIVLM